MADRYQDRLYPAHNDYGRGDDQHAGSRAESDPLAELARLIGQTDPYAMGRANVKPQPQPYQPAAETEDALPPGPPPWLQRAHRQETAPPPPPQEYEDEADYQPSPVHPLHRYAAQHAASEPQYRDQPPHSDQPYRDQEPDPSRYDDALYGEIEASQEDYQRDPAYPDDPYAYQQAYDEEPEDPPRRRGGMVTVAAVLALAVLGTGAALAYRNFIASPRSGEPPIIKADNTPTKVMPAGTDGAPKAPDRMALGDGSEKLVPREETPIDVNARSGPRVVFPPLNPNSNPPSVASVAPSVAAPASTAANGTLPSNEPRKIKTLTVKGDTADSGVPANAGPPPAKQPARAAQPARNPSSANASANAPLSLTPGTSAAPEPQARIAAVNPSVPVTSSGGYVVQVSSQKNEADAQASYRSLQNKFPSVLGSRAPLIKRADLGDKGVYYRAMVGPFGSQDEASQFCGNLKTAGGQCVVQRN